MGYILLMFVVIRILACGALYAITKPSKRRARQLAPADPAPTESSALLAAGEVTAKV